MACLTPVAYFLIFSGLHELCTCSTFIPRPSLCSGDYILQPSCHVCSPDGFHYRRQVNISMLLTSSGCRHCIMNNFFLHYMLLEIFQLHRCCNTLFPVHGTEYFSLSKLETWIRY